MNCDPSNNECQKDPIFLLQSRKYSLTCCPDWLGYDGDYFWIEYKNVGEVDTSQWTFLVKGDIDQRKLYEYLCNYYGSDPDYHPNDSAAAVEFWETSSVWLTRNEAERFAKSTENRYEFGWRVYCLSACGELAEVLNKAEASAIAAVGGVG